MKCERLLHQTVLDSRAQLGKCIPNRFRKLGVVRGCEELTRQLQTTADHSVTDEIEGNGLPRVAQSHFPAEIRRTHLVVVEFVAVKGLPADPEAMRRWQLAERRLGVLEGGGRREFNCGRTVRELRRIMRPFVTVCWSMNGECTERIQVRLPAN